MPLLIVPPRRFLVHTLASLMVAVAFAAAQTVPAHVQEKNVRAQLEFLADDALQGRGSGTEYERIAGTYIASQLAQFGIEPAAASDGSGVKNFLQSVPVKNRKFKSTPVLKAGAHVWTHGRQIAVLSAVGTEFSGPLQKWKPGDEIKKGAVVLLYISDKVASGPPQRQIVAPLRQGAVAVLVADSELLRARFEEAANAMPELPAQIGAETPAPGGNRNIVLLNSAATKQMGALAAGTKINFHGAIKQDMGATWNVIGMLRGSDPELSKQAILLTAHMDHLGTDSKAKGDQIYNGADDDASGVVTVLELARALGAAPPPKRTVYFVLFGSEEKGGYGAQYFLEHPPVPLESIAANLEFEMIGRPDGKVDAQSLWLTGWERSNLGPELAKQGARLVPDPHPEQQFFMRSDNYVLARRGVVAQTVSSYGLHGDYHTPSDDVAHIDFAHMTRAIDSMVKPVLWLVNSDFTPQWLEGKKP